MAVDFPTRPLRVLVADDSRDSAETTAFLLRLWGYETCLVFDGRDAVRAADTFIPEAALLDLGMPGLDGWEVARRLRQHPGLIGILLVAVSGYGQPDDLRRCREAGFDHHFLKPFDVDRLAQLLGGHAAKKAQLGM